MLRFLTGGLVVLFAATAAPANPVIPRQGNRPCPTGYYASGSGCVGFHRDTPQAIPRQKGKSCPSGTHASGDYCKAFR